MKKMKKYNLTEGLNKDVKDEMPEWMENIQNIMDNNSINKNTNYIAQIEDSIINPKKQKIKTCSVCNTILKTNEVSYCNNCQ